MNNRERLWFIGYAAAQAFFWLGFSIYYTYTRMYVEDLLGQNYAFIALLVGAEEAPLLLAVLLGYLADKMGRRKALLLGFGEAIAVGLMGLTSIWMLPFLAAIAASFYAIAYSALTGIILASVGGSGWKYSLVTLLSSIGWAMGGVIAGVLYGYGPMAEYGCSASFVALGYLLAYMLAPSSEDGAKTRVSTRQVITAAYKLVPITASIVLSATGLMLFYGAVSLKLAREVNDPILFGLVYSTLSALLGALVRPLAGLLTDRVDPLVLMVVSSLAYTVLNFGIAIAHGIILVVLWLTPIYPFRDVAIYMAVSRSLPRELQATAAGMVSFAISLSGIIIVLISPLLHGKTILELYVITAALLILSALALIPLLVGRSGQRV